MAYTDEFGVNHGYDNSFSGLINRLFSNPIGWILAILPLIILISIFFILKYYWKKENKILIIYSVLSVLFYLIYIWLLLQQMVKF